MARRTFCFIIVASEVKAVFDMDQHKRPRKIFAAVNEPGEVALTAGLLI
jgi:hypothetical protein